MNLNLSVVAGGILRGTEHSQLLVPGNVFRLLKSGSLQQNTIYFL
jgi:hypothetical protein